MAPVRERFILSLLVIAFLVAACDSSSSSSEEAEAEARVTSAVVTEEGEVSDGAEGGLELILHGALRQVNLHQDYSPTVRLADLEPSSPNHGLGALGGLMGELALWDDRLYLAHAEDDEVTFRSMSLSEVAEEAPELEATLFFGAQVGRWDTLEDHGVTTLESLEAYLDRWTEAQGVAGPVAFRITDPLATVDWHVVDATRFPEEGATSCGERKEFGHSFETTRQPARLVGLFTREHTGVVVDHTTLLHTHVITDRGEAGHVDDLQLSVGAVIQVGTL